MLREALSRGADRVVLLTDRRAAASDTLATGYILSRAVKKLSPDLVLCGRQAIDGDTAQVGPQLAQKLGVNLVTYVEQLLSLENQSISVRRNVGNGWEAVRCKLPALLTVMETANTPRPPAARRIMKYKHARCASEIAKQLDQEIPDAGDEQKVQVLHRRREQMKKRGLLIEQWSLDDLNIDFSWCGRDGSPTKVHRIQSIVLTGGEYRQFPPTDEGIAKLVGELIEDHTIG